MKKTTETTKEKNGMKVTVTIEREVKDDNAYADGWNVTTGKRATEFVTVTIEKNGKTACCRDLNFVYRLTDEYRGPKTPPKAHARFGDTYISKEVYDTILEAIDEAYEAANADSPEGFAKVEAAREKAAAEENDGDAKYAAIMADRRRHPGWCDKCHSYCYGDCQA
jgi:hypothetical protein